MRFLILALLSYLSMVRGQMFRDASNKCASHKVQLLGDSHLSAACRNGNKTAVMEAIFRCEEG